MRNLSRSLARQSLLVASACLVADVGMVLVEGWLLPYGWRGWLVLAATVVADAALAAPGRHSGMVAVGHAVLAAGTAVLLCTCDGIDMPNTTGILVAGYQAGAWLRTPAAVLTLLTMMTGLSWFYLAASSYVSTDWRLLALSVLAVGVLPWLVGRFTTARRAYLAELDAIAAQRRMDEQQAVRRAVLEERSAIARDLHDVISHHVSAIGMHAGAARLGLPVAPDPAVRRSLAAVESASRSAMADLRRLLDLLHGQNDDATHQPGLGDLDELLDGVAAAGLAVRLSTQGTARPLPDSLDIALYRITQEALTNVLRHGGGPVAVDLAYQPDGVELTVTNEITAPPEPHNGDNADGPHRGLAGIRRRVALFGGQVTYGTQADGRHWRLRVSLPVEWS